jgi:hypothetical protein
MKLRSPIIAMLWELWRITRSEVAWKLALSIGISVAALALGAVFGPSDPEKHQDVIDNVAVLALILIVIPHVSGWLSMAKLNGGKPGYPLYLTYARPVRTVIIVGLPMAYLAAVSTAMYLVSAMVVGVASGYAFPLLPVAAWMAALTLAWVAVSWSTRNVAIAACGFMFAIAQVLKLAMDRLTSAPHGFRWYNSPKFWPTLFDFPHTDYVWIVLIGLGCFGVTVAGVMRQRRGDGWAEAPSARRDGSWDPLINVFRFRCPILSATRAQLWFDLKSNGLPVLTIGVACALVILLMSAVSGRIDAAINADPRMSCPETVTRECFFARAWPPILAPLSLLTMLFLAGNAFGIRRRQGRTYVSAFEATQACGTAQVAVLKIFVKSVCVLTALVAIGVSAWISMSLLGDAVFIQMWGVPLNTRRSALNVAVAALTGYEQLALVVVTAVAVVVWVATLAVLGALRARYSRRVNIAALSLLLFGLSLAVLALATWRGMGPEIPLGAILRATSWIAAAAIVFATAYLVWRMFAERLLTVRQAWGIVFLSAVFAAAWLTVLRAAGLSLADMPVASAVRMLWPAFLTFTVSVLAPWSYSRIRHT